MSLPLLLRSLEDHLSRQQEISFADKKKDIQDRITRMQQRLAEVQAELKNLS